MSSLNDFRIEVIETLCELGGCSEENAQTLAEEKHTDIVSGLVSLWNIKHPQSDLAKANKVGYMEALKMTTKILEGYGREETFNVWKGIILNEYMQCRSGVLPFRYYTAFVAPKLWNDPDALVKEIESIDL